MDLGTNRLFDSPRIKWIQLVFLGCVLLIFYGSDIQSVPFHPDESRKISTSYFLEPFIHGDFTSPVWDVSYWTLTHPPVGRYIVGLGRLSGGYGITELNKPWDFEVSHDTNAKRGAMPSPSLLWWSRLPMAILAVASGLILFRLVGASAGRVAGYAVLLLFVANSFFLIILRRAWQEGPLLLGILLAALACDYGLRSWERATDGSDGSLKALLRPLLWFTLVGVLSGVAGAVKLNGLSAAFAGGILCLVAPLRHKDNIPKSVYVLAMGACAATFLGAGLAFVSLNPFLHSDPLIRTAKMFRHRLGEMRAQTVSFPEDHLYGIWPRVAVVSQRIFEDYASISFDGVRLVNLILCVLGAFYITRTAWRWLRGQESSGTSMVILAIAFFTALPSLLTPLDWDRYYLLPVVFSTVCIAAGISLVIQVLWGSVLSSGVRDILHKWR